MSADGPNYFSPERYFQLRASPHLQRRLEVVCDAVHRFAKPPARVLDLGCGVGNLTAAMARTWPEAKVVGVDLDQSYVAFAARESQTPNATFRRLDIMSADAAELGALGRFDLVVSADVIHHVRSYAEMFRRAAGLLTPAGVWVAVEPNWWHPYVAFSQVWKRWRGHDEANFNQFAAERQWAAAGFSVRAKRFMLFWPAWWRWRGAFAERIERRLEGLPLCGGSVVYSLQLSRRAADSPR
jgi:2-polyprenyl-3-methyl-5-hydroxy-6-metoxy-1,4-benzoquinol methylase